MAKEEPMTMDEVELVPPDDERDGACAVARMLRAVLVEAGGKARLHWLNEAGEIVDEMALDPARPAGRALVRLARRAELAEELVAVLFPPPEPIRGTGCMISRHVTEIWGPILDIDHARGLCDEISMNTLRRVAEKLDEAAWLAGQMKACG
jgi:hypothetical protein